LNTGKKKKGRSVGKTFGLFQKKGGGKEDLAGGGQKKT